jgi:glycosyltransferase involved in cell wall biosynthesis
MPVPSFKVITYGWDRHVGLQHDAALLYQSLVELGHSAIVLKRPSYRTFSWRVLMSRRARALRADQVVRRGLRTLSVVQRRINRRPQRVALHVQYPSPRHLVNGATQVFVPNPEWFWDRDAWALPLIDVVLCKTRHAVPIFAAAGCAVEYVGFTSEDCHVPGISPDRSSWLHIASNGHQKGTDEVVEAWHRHPEWPNLTVVAGKRSASTPPARNLQVIDTWLDDEQLHELMQRSGVHLCPSNAEGFGHTIVEAMSCGVLVLTTDLEPMNEIVDESRGMLVDVAETSPMGWSRRATFAQDALEATVERAIALSEAQYVRRASTARQWYLDNDAAFRQRLEAFAARLATTGLKGSDRKK